MTSSVRARGFTLVELLISIAISAILLAAIFGVVQGQQTAFFQGQLQRAAQGSARQALAFVESKLQVAGYGMDGPLAFDFNRYGPDADTAPNTLPCPALAAPCERDRIDGNDELVFYARNPRYWVPEDRGGIVQPVGNAWRVVAVDAGQVQLQLKPNDVIEKGRILQLVCKDGAQYLYATVSATTRADAGATAVATKPVPLLASVATNPFRRQALAGPGDCFNSGNARAFFIDRFRFHVRPVNVGGNAGVRPYLVLDTGLDLNGDGPDEDEEIVVAEGIESFQVGYVLTATSATFPARGTTPGTKITFTPGAGGNTTGIGTITTLAYPGVPDPGEWEYQATSFYRHSVGPTPAIAPERLTDHQGNVRAVRVVIVARGPEPEPAARRVDTLLPILNQNALPAWIAADVPYNRARVETTVPVRNLTTRAMNDF